MNVAVGEMAWVRGDKQRPRNLKDVVRPPPCPALLMNMAAYRGMDNTILQSNNKLNTQMGKY